MEAWPYGRSGQSPHAQEPVDLEHGQEPGKEHVLIQHLGTVVETAQGIWMKYRAVFRVSYEAVQVGIILSLIIFLTEME